ncbi:hypothetical protein [Enterococcus gilvus]|uniref:Uncharacterized protein n=1 Tax=Enterococcus gilvus ATCC BAA-350 TaxID=1158614 RepID=R2XQR4_9ENTE|nr:hypothetical protein [Enterococcus gilvus]EOI56873.1 hypothetical protein UKC_01058 [Enterococcus gilvus ATCC BAA-350]EOW83553.1 hypothetical protein I592_02912 [Enterococcus gilvus ATCC BAA-350]
MGNNTKAIIIVHGKSELTIAQFIKSNLRLPIEIVSRDKGRSSIQIGSLDNLLTDFRFKNIKNFVKTFSSVEFNKKEMINCKIFMIMDLDDADISAQESYKNKIMFNKYWFKEYIEPIYNNRNLEDVLKEMGYPYAKTKSKKGEYVTVFPVADARGADRKQIEEFCEACKKCKNTNMEILLEYCLQQTVKYI